MLAPRLFIPFDQHVVLRIQEQDLIFGLPAVQFIQHFLQPVKILTAPHVDPQGDLLHFLIRLTEHLHKAGEQGDGQVVHAEIPHILQHLQRRRLSRS